MAAMKARLNFLSERQNTLSMNIANADTPKFKAKDLEPVDFNALIHKEKRVVHLKTTSDAHMDTKRNITKYDVIKNESPYETKPNGNNVILEEQMVKMANNNMEYQETLSLVRKITSMLKMAIGRQA